MYLVACLVNYVAISALAFAAGFAASFLLYLLSSFASLAHVVFQISMLVETKAIM